jgi:hypothetical protein
MVGFRGRFLSGISRGFAVAALGQVKKWKIAGRQLELRDDSGAVVAVLEAGGLKDTQ